MTSRDEEAGVDAALVRCSLAVVALVSVTEGAPPAFSLSRKGLPARALHLGFISCWAPRGASLPAHALRSNPGCCTIGWSVDKHPFTLQQWTMPQEPSQSSPLLNLKQVVRRSGSRA